MKSRQFAKFANDRGLSILLLFAAAISFFLILRRAVTGLDVIWDTFAYHLPFAARLAGLCDAQCFQMRPGHEDRYAGFPMFATWLQSVIWRVFGTPNWGDLINCAALGVVVTAAKIYLRIPMALFATALFAVPLIQIHLSLTYIDLFCNAAVMVSIILMLSFFLDQKAAPWRLLFAFFPLAAAANSKYQMLPISAGLTLLICLLFLGRVKHYPRKHIGLFALGVAVLTPLVFATPLINLQKFHNPVYPIRAQILGHVLEGSEAPKSPFSVSPYWETKPQAVIWLASIFEVEAYESRPITWEGSQGAVAIGAHSFRMGGYFGIYVVGNLLLLAFSLANTPARLRVWLSGVFGGITACTAILPASHELRYYLYWMMSLILLNLTLCVRADLAISKIRQSVHRTAYSWMALSALVSVAAITGGAYLGPHFDSSSIQTLLVERNVSSAMAQFEENKVNCLGESYEPFRFLYADIFHEGREFSVRELDADAPAGDCGVLMR